MAVTLSKEFLELLHDTVLENDPNAAPGYTHRSMIEGSMDRAVTRIYGLEPFPTIIDKAAALMYSIATFHPFTDGNKRTALLATYFFLAFNGYNFTITNDSIRFLIEIGRGKIKNEREVAIWLREHTRKNLLARLVIRITGLFGTDITITPKIAETSFLSSSLSNITASLLEITRKLWPPKKHTHKEEQA